MGRADALAPGPGSPALYRRTAGRAVPQILWQAVEDRAHVGDQLAAVLVRAAGAGCATKRRVQGRAAAGRATVRKGPQNHARIRAAHVMAGKAAAWRKSERDVSLARVWWSKRSCPRNRLCSPAGAPRFSVVGTREVSAGLRSRPQRSQGVESKVEKTACKTGDHREATSAADSQTTRKPTLNTRCHGGQASRKAARQRFGGS